MFSVCDVIKDQFIRDVNWAPLDFLIVDLPPGTGDVQLSLAQKIPLAGAVIVSTPQNTSLADVVRCVDMFKRVQTPILGLIENMASYTCTHCNHEEELFVSGDLHSFADKERIELLGKIPFVKAIGQGSENGVPAVVANTNPNVTESYKAIAQKISQKFN
jgi:ATP-binding protein involved in chromosome partitioning